jgi:hypothetical protein
VLFWSQPRLEYGDCGPWSENFSGESCGGFWAVFGVCNSDAIAVDIGLTKAQKWLIEWLREGVKHDEKHMAILKDMEEDTRRANKVARPPDCDEELALMQKVLLDLKEPKTKGNRELFLCGLLFALLFFWGTFVCSGGREFF